MVSDGAFLFHMCIPCSKTFSLVIRSKSPVKVKVKYQGHIFKKKKKKKWLLQFHLSFTNTACSLSFVNLKVTQLLIG